MAIMRKAFQMFDDTKSGFIETMKISTILNSMGQLFDDKELQSLINENDPDNMGKVNFDGFVAIAAHFLEEEDDESTQQELKEAFRSNRFALGVFCCKIVLQIVRQRRQRLHNHRNFKRDPQGLGR